MNALANVIDYSECVDVIASATSKAAARMQGCKVISFAAAVNERTVENIAQRRSAPNALTLINMARNIPEIKAAVLRLIDAEQNLDPMFAHKMNELMTHWMRSGQQITAKKEAAE